eukprot:scaffold2193_cov179-Ochromonas_danica.AAC.36
MSSEKQAQPQVLNARTKRYDFLSLIPAQEVITFRPSIENLRCKEENIPSPTPVCALIPSTSVLGVPRRSALRQCSQSSHYVIHYLELVKASIDGKAIDSTGYL